MTSRQKQLLCWLLVYRAGMRPLGPAEAAWGEMHYRGRMLVSPVTAGGRRRAR